MPPPEMPPRDMSVNDEKHSNRPEDSAFKQQRLKAWQPILTPRWVIGTFILIGIVFVPIGIALKVQSDGLFEETIVYDGASVSTGVSSACSITTQNQGYTALMTTNGAAPQCTLNFTLGTAAEATSGLYLYYQITNMYQNHRRYVKSRNDPQLANQDPGASALQTTCDPYASFVNVNVSPQRMYYPCGLIATSFFNEGIHLSLVNGVSAATAGYYINTNNTAWVTDADFKFQNPTALINQWDTYQYLWQTYDQMSCRNSAGGIVKCQTWGDLVDGAYGTGCAACPPGSVPQSEGGVAPPGGWAGFNYTTGFVGSASASDGLRDPHFMVWMRTAALPTFRKLYGQLMPPAGQQWHAGDVLTFTVVPNFEVLSFQGTKGLVVSEATPLGGKSGVLGIAYLVVGTLCWGLAILFAAKHLIAPRKLGDTQYIVWRRAANEHTPAQ